jgi:translation initiation factor IF-2
VPVRIYALAKDLKIDSKDLVTLCNKIGITGKGSALASLEDDEVARVKKYLAGGAANSGGSSAAPAPSAAATAAPPSPIAPIPPRQDPAISPIDRANRPIGMIRTPASGSDAKGTAPAAEAPATAPVAPAPAPVPETPVVEPVVAVSPVAESPVVEEPPPPAPVAEAPVSRPAAGEPAAPVETFTREDYARVAPVSGAGKMRMIGSRSSSKSSQEKDKDKDKDKGAEKPSEEKAKRPQGPRAPVINLARIPKSAQAPPQQRPRNEPAPQKPEIRLTRDSLAGHKTGSKAHLEELQQREAAASAAPAKPQRQKPADPGAAAPGFVPPGGLTEFKNAAEKARSTKGKRVGTDDEEAEVRKKIGAGVSQARAERAKKKIRGPEDVEEEGRSEVDDRRAAKRKTLVRRGNNTAAPRKDKSALELPCSIRNFSEATGVTAAKVLKSLMGMGKMLNINAALDEETAFMLASDLGVEVEFKKPESLENEMIQQIENREDSEEDLIQRPPIVTFLGHVDHGKTSLLDYMIGTKIVSGEAGGITQQIRAYQVDKDGKLISFVDTPGHEAFTEMRARGANVTDIAVLVIAADDGIMPQTEEAISHAKAAGVPIVVALNKIDLPGANPDRVKTQMTQFGLTPSEWGGDVEVVPTSAITGQGMDMLLDTLLTVAELHDYRANPKREAVGVVLESGQASDRGVIAKVIVQNGTLKVGDIVVCGAAHGRVKAIYDSLRPNKMVKDAGPSTPVNITGLDTPPNAGDRFYVIDDIAKAREIASSRADTSRTQSLSGSTTKVSFADFQSLLQSGKLGKKEDKVQLNLIIRADARGSLEAIEKEISKLEQHPEVDIRILQKSVGGITVADVTLAHASQGVIVGFNVIPDEQARGLAEERQVEIRRYDIIYKLAEDIKAIIEGRLRPEEKVIELGRALVKQVFSISRVGAIAGCYVAQGTIERGCRIRVNRDGRTIGDYALDSLKRHKDDAKEVPRGMECGIKLAGFNDIKPDDVLEAYKIEEVARTLD